MLSPTHTGFEDNPNILVGAPAGHYLLRPNLLRPSQMHLKKSPAYGHGGLASREEIELTKRYLGINEQIK